MQIGRPRAPAPAVADGHLVGAEALLLDAVEVGRQLVAGLAAGGDEAE